jgi:hypothetical protein
LEAIAVASGYPTSAVGSAAYTISAPQAATPTFSPAAGMYTSAQTVTISTSTPGATIYYTTDGSTPTAGSALYLGPRTVSATETLEAIAVANGYATSATGSAAYTINTSQAATPTFSPAAGTYGATQTVTISTSTPGATIYYTTDGSAPTTSSTVYFVPIIVAASETVQAIAVEAGYSTSATATADYSLNLTTPSFSVAVSPGALSVTAGQSTAASVMVTPQNSFASPVTFSCTGLPSGATCSFSPATVTPVGGTAMTTLTVTTTTTTANLRRNSSPLFPGSTLAVALCLLGWKKRRVLPLMLLALVTLGLSICTGCGVGLTPTSQAAKATVSTVTVIATSGSIQPTASFTLTVQ